MRFYRWILSALIVPILRGFVFRDRNYKSLKINVQPFRSKTIWFHGASAGELETLIPVVERALKNSDFHLIVTSFSPSGLGALKQLERWSRENHCHTRFSMGLSPWEGEWKEALLAAKPLFFITSKYEAWPELWVSLVELKIPLEIIAARDRTSLRIAKKVCKAVTGSLPELYLDADEDSASELSKLFKAQSIQVLPDTRWDRVADRKLRTSERAKEILQAVQSMKRTHSVLGSFWVDDFILLDQFDFTKNENLLCVVPHDVNSKNVSQIFRQFESLGAKVVCSKGRSKEEIISELKTKNVLLVDEVGVLLDLYTDSKWVYVGGGFSKGVHSTIEPALAQAPISCGPKRMNEFSEIHYLRKTGQLHLVTSAPEFQAWLTHVGAESNLNKSYWLQQNQTKLGASDKVWTKIKTILEVNNVKSISGH